MLLFKCFLLLCTHLCIFLLVKAFNEEKNLGTKYMCWRSAKCNCYYLYMFATFKCENLKTGCSPGTPGQVQIHTQKSTRLDCKSATNKTYIWNTADTTGSFSHKSKTLNSGFRLKNHHLRFHSPAKRVAGLFRLQCTNCPATDATHTCQAHHYLSQAKQPSCQC